MDTPGEEQRVEVLDEEVLDEEVLDEEALDKASCLALLRTAVIGRIAFTERALPAVRPVSFVLDDGEVCVPTHPGSAVAAGSRGAVVAFEVDEVDLRARTGWNVTVVGPSRLITDRAEIRRLDELGVRAWAPGARHCYVGIAVRVVGGRRICRSDAVDGVPVRATPRATALPG